MSTARENWVKFRAREHNHSHHIVRISETKGSTDDEFNFIVGGFGAGVGEPKLGSSNDGTKMALNFLAQIPEHEDPASPGQAIHLVSSLAISSGPALSARCRFSLSR